MSIATVLRALDVGGKGIATPSSTHQAHDLNLLHRNFIAHSFTKYDDCTLHCGTEILGRRMLQGSGASLWSSTACTSATNCSGSDLDWGQETGTPGLLEFVFCVRPIADDHNFLGVHLHVGLLQSLKEISVTISMIVGKARSGTDQDH
eukprot:4154396-Amphidinium_carterae.2